MCEMESVLCRCCVLDGSCQIHEFPSYSRSTAWRRRRRKSFDWSADAITDSMRLQGTWSATASSPRKYTLDSFRARNGYSSGLYCLPALWYSSNFPQSKGPNSYLGIIPNLNSFHQLCKGANSISWTLDRYANMYFEPCSFIHCSLGILQRTISSQRPLPVKFSSWFVHLMS